MNTSTYATTAGTHRFMDRFDHFAPGHFRLSNDLWWSSIGIGSYLGGYDDHTDAGYREAVALAVKRGINVVDTAINYRLQRSERAIGQALRQVFAAGTAMRDELILCSKGGFLPYDTVPPADPVQYIRETYLAPGIARREDFVGSHCIAPTYLQLELNQSLQNLGLSCLDVYYVHNPETQLQVVEREVFRDRLRAAFEALEAAVDAGKIRRYGVATWNGFRQTPSDHDYLSLNEVVTLAAEAGGVDHHFRVIQLPYNLAMPEAFARRNQQVGDEMMSTVEAAQKLGITVVASASLLQSQLAHDLPEPLQAVFKALETDAQRALQFVRSTPGITTALVGMSQARHVEENIRTALHPPMPAEEIRALFA